MALPRAVALMLLSCAAAAADSTSPSSTWPDTFVARLEALVLLETLNSELLSHDSATITLEHWCDDHRLALPARVVAERVAVVDKSPSSDQRRELDVSDSEAVHYRRVRLSCGATVLSEADNWYVPGRLTAEMNRQLETTNAPFGKVVQPLHFRRRTLAADLLWHPLPVGWEMQARRIADGRGALPIPPEVLQHRALLTLPDGTPMSEVIETYTYSVLGAAPATAAGPCGPPQSSPN